MCATNARVPAAVQRVVEDIVRADIFPNLRLVPVSEWIEFDHSELCVPFQLARLRSSRRLFATNADDPGRGCFQPIGYRLDLSHCAATIRLCRPQCVPEFSRLFIWSQPRTKTL